MFSLRTLTAVVVLTIGVGVVAGPAAAGTVCVGPKSGCFPQLQPAIAAAADGDTITVAPGTYTGGITIDKSIRVQGAGSGATVIKGGGPVVTIFRATAPDGLNVSIDGVSITGGVNSTQPDPEVTFGGGIWIPTSQLDHPPFNGIGATVAISNSEITGNVVTSNSAIPPGFCGPRACGFNSGGGIDNGGALTLTNSRVTNNTAGSTSASASAASDPNSGGIDNRFASTLVVHRSIVSGNHVLANSPIAASASAGGIGSPGLLDVEDSVVSDNTVEYTGALVDDADQAGFAGGVLVNQFDFYPHDPATIRNTLITGNRVIATNTDTSAFPQGYGGGVVALGAALFDHVQLTGNTVQVNGVGLALGDGGGMEVDAPVTMRDSIVARNSVSVHGQAGAVGFGGGLAMFGGDLTLERTLVLANTVSATGAVAPLPFPGGALGGGISNGGPDVPSANLTLTNSVVLGNSLTASTGYVVQGGGVFNGGTVTRTRTLIAGNKPDDCFGC
ncbi:MAG TPA: hypothetical protein VLK36_06830 [Gaiellaceae bacterium]|nr:hypothetical protein [Gaiellaceae bacterium]